MLLVTEPHIKLNKQTERYCASLLAGETRRYLVDCRIPVSEVAGRRLQRSASLQHLTVILHYWLNMIWCLALSVLSPTS